MPVPDTAYREYPLSLFNKIFNSLMAACLLGFSVYMAAKPVKHPEVVWVMAPVMTSMALLLLVSLRRKLILTNNSITSVGLFTTKQLQLAAIKGRRYQSSAIILEPVSATCPAIKVVYADFAGGQGLAEWLKTNYVDLDAGDLAAAEQQLSEDETFGNHPTARLQLLQRAKTIVPVYNTVAVAGSFICILTGGIYCSVVMLLLPLAGILLLFSHRGLIKFYSESWRSIHPAVFWGVFLSSAFVLMHTVFNYDLLLWQQQQVPALIIAAMVGWLLYKKGINQAAGAQKAQVGWMLVTALAYGFAAVRLLNCAFDNGKSTAYNAVVQERFISNSKSTDHYYLVLGPWGPKHSTGQVEVSRLIYRVKYPGDTVIVQMKPGLLRMPWYWVSK